MVNLNQTIFSIDAVKKLDKEIADYLLHLSIEQKKVVLRVVKSFAREDDARWDNQQYIDEMDRRLSELERGEVKGITFETLASEARKAFLPVSSTNPIRF